MIEVVMSIMLSVSVVALVFMYRSLSAKNDLLRGEQVENARLKERLEILENEKEKMERANELRFKNLANEILQANSAQFKLQQESRLVELLQPLRENIQSFRQALSQNFVTETADRKVLAERIAELKELQRSLGREARELTTALRGNSKVQGDWGEMILESILERSGLEKGVHYKVQESFEKGAVRPDVVIYYPDGRAIVVDSKVSLTAFVQLVNAGSDDEREEYSKQHVASVKRHISELSEKRYQDYPGVGKADFVMMFIPNEPAYIAAMQADETLWQYAFDKNVIVLSPTHLLTVLSLVSQLWRQDKVTRNYVSIAVESGKLYDKLVGFIDDMQKINKSLTAAQAAYSDAISKLSTGKGSVMKKAEALKEQGAKATKSLPSNLTEGD
ncbi:MAG: DNA recombination protein RmuC [Muribaculaceae bacterium]